MDWFRTANVDWPYRSATLHLSDVMLDYVGSVWPPRPTTSNIVASNNVGWCWTMLGSFGQGFNRSRSMKMHTEVTLFMYKFIYFIHNSLSICLLRKLTNDQLDIFKYLLFSRSCYFLWCAAALGTGYRVWEVRDRDWFEWMSRRIDFYYLRPGCILCIEL